MNSVKDAFFYEIYNNIKNGKEIYIVTADLGAKSLDDLRKNFPDKYISVGIAEQNLISVAAGIAVTGKRVIAYGLNPFPITRAYDQIRCLMNELKIPITVCTLNSGLCAAECGYTHMPIEDMTLLGSLYNIEIYNPTDENISSCLADETINNKKPRIIRFDKELAGRIYDNYKNDNTGLKITNNDNDYNNICILTYGYNVKLIIDNFDKLPKNIKLIDMYKFPFNVNVFLNEIKLCDKIIIIEENVKSFGLGSYIVGVLCDNNINKKVFRMGLDFYDGYYELYLNRKLIREKQKIDLNSIIDVLKI